MQNFMLGMNSWLILNDFAFFCHLNLNFRKKDEIPSSRAPILREESLFDFVLNQERFFASLRTTNKGFSATCSTCRAN